MSVDYNVEYYNHTLLDNQAKYDKIYKLTEVVASDVHRGDLVLLKTPCGQYKLYMAIDDSGEDNTLHLTRYAEIDFYKSNYDPNSDLVISESDSCGNQVNNNCNCDCGCNSCSCSNSNNISSSCGC